MIGRLRGELAEVGEEEALVDVGGVGYLVRCGSRTLSRLPPLGEMVVLHIDSQTREDGTRLYGFVTREERQAFVLLQGVQGVGPKAALSVLDVLPPSELAAAIARDDKAMVGRANGVGPKLALRIVVELKDKPIGAGDVAGFHAQVTAGAAPTPAAPSVAGEAVAALMGLGTPESVGRRAVEKAFERLGPDAPLQAVVRGALQELGR
ncbi:MAG: Holliday junction branch migration protein RuvA [Caulobacteraceae bacterium]